MLDTIDDIRGVSAEDGSTKARIERAALILFAEHGIDGVSTKQIAANAGISEGAIYRHFSGKEALAREMMLTIHGRLTDMINQAAEIDGDLQSRVEFIVREYCRIADEDWALFQYHILHLHHFSRLSHAPERSPIGAAAGLLEEAMTTGEIRFMDPSLLASMALGVVLQAAQARVLGFIDGPLSARTDIFAQTVFAVLGLETDI